MIREFLRFARAFTLIELLVVIAAIGILLAIAVPALTSAFERAKATKDLSNLRQIGMLMQTYLNDNDQILPVTATWPGISHTARRPGALSEIHCDQKGFPVAF